MSQRPFLRIHISETARQSPLSLARAQAYEAAAPVSGWEVIPSDHELDFGRGAPEAVVVIGAPVTEIHDLLVNGHGVLADGIWSDDPAEVEKIVQVAAQHRQPLQQGDELLHAPVLSGALTEACGIGRITTCESRGLRPHHGGPISRQELMTSAPTVIMRALLLVQVLLPAPVTIDWDAAQISELPRNGLRATWRAKVSNNQGQSPVLLNVVVATHTGNSVIQDLQVSSATGVVRAELMPTPRLEVNGDPVHITQSDPAAQTTPPVPSQLEWFGMVPMLQLFRRATVQRTQPLTGPALLARALRLTALALGEADDPSQ
jgi:hypothetical protein